MISKTGNKPEVLEKSWFLVFKRIFKAENLGDDGGDYFLSNEHNIFILKAGNEDNKPEVSEKSWV